MHDVTNAAGHLGAALGGRGGQAVRLDKAGGSPPIHTRTHHTHTHQNDTSTTQHTHFFFKGVLQDTSVMHVLA